MRSIAFLLGLVLATCAGPAYAQISTDEADATKIAGVALPACTAQTLRDYFIVDSDDPDSCTGGSGTLYSGVNYCYCDKNDLEWKVGWSTLDEGALQALLASTANGEGASMIGVEDAGGRFVTSNLETVLAEIHVLASAGGGGGFVPDADPGVDHSGYVAGHGDGTDCPAGQYARGVDGSGNATGCTADANDGGGAVSEAELESDLADVTDVFTNNDGALDDDDLSDNDTGDLAEGANLYYTQARVDARIGAVAPSVHGSTHLNGSTDPIPIEGLPTFVNDTALVLRPDGAGSVTFGADAGATNISASVGASTIDVNSSTGAGATLPAATSTTAGVLTASQYNDLVAWADGNFHAATFAIAFPATLTDGIQEAWDACGTAGGGVVHIGTGHKTLFGDAAMVGSVLRAPTILDENSTPHGSCTLAGLGTGGPGQDFDDMTAGSAIEFVNLANITADSDGVRSGIGLTSSGQHLRGLNIALNSGGAGVGANAAAILVRTPGGAGVDPGELSLTDWSITDVKVKGSSPGAPGKGLMLVSAMEGIVSDSVFENLDAGISVEPAPCTDLYDTGNPQTSGSPDGLCDRDTGAPTLHYRAANNATIIDGVTVRASDVGVDIGTAWACTHMTLSGISSEDNTVAGARLQAGSRCLLKDVAGRHENATAAPDILIQTDLGNYAGLGTWYGGGQPDITRTIAKDASIGDDVVIAGTFNGDVTAPAGEEPCLLKPTQLPDNAAGSGTYLVDRDCLTGTDDDVPESGDFGAAADLEADGSISAGAVTAADVTYDNSTSGLFATDVKGALDELTAEKVDIAEAKSVLIGGEGSIADQVDPNSPLIVCPLSNANCEYLSTETGWWDATTSDGASATTWSARNEVLIWDHQFETGAEMNVATYSGTNCAAMQFGNETTSDGLCSDENHKHSFARDYYLTRFVGIARDGDASNPAWTNEDGCSFKLVSGIDGSTDITNGELDFPDSSVPLNEGDIVEQIVGEILSAGTSFSIKSRDGDFCDDGTTPATCDCVNARYVHLGLWAVPR